LLYDPQDAIFVDGIVYKGQIYQFQRGYPSATHRLLDSILQHPRLGFLKEKLSFRSSTYVPPSSQTLNGAPVYVYQQGKEGIHYAHTLSFWACSIFSKQRYIPPIDAFRAFLKLCEDYLEERKDLLEYWNILSRLFSYFNFLEENSQLKEIAKKKIIEITNRFLDFLELLKELKKGRMPTTVLQPSFKLDKNGLRGHIDWISQFNAPKTSSFYLDPYIFSLLSEISSSIKEIDCYEYLSELKREIENTHKPGSIVVDEKNIFDMEGTLAFLYGLSKMNQINKEEFLEVIYKDLKGIRDRLEVQTHEKMFGKVLFEGSLTFKLRVEDLKANVGGIEQIEWYIHDGIPYYFLKLSGSLRGIFKEELKDYPTYYSERDIIRLCRMRKRS
jgi:hypothetical protein